MRLWQKQAHPWIWLLVTILVVGVAVLLIEQQPELLQLR